MAFVHAPHVHAATATTYSLESIGGQVGLGNADLKQVIINIIKWALGLLALVAVSYMIYGGYVWMTAAGNEARVEKAKQIILQAAIGLVIVLLSWAIVLFVTKSLLNVTTNTDAGTTCTPGVDCAIPPVTGDEFDITAINTCAVPPKTYENVPRSSSVSITFNTDVQTTPNYVQTAVGTGADDLQIVKICTDLAAGCVVGSPIAPNPAPIDNQVYTSGPKPTATAADLPQKAEWVLKDNSLTFYHLTLAQCKDGTKIGQTCAADTDCTDPDATTHVCQKTDRYFDASSTYRVTIPKDTNTKALKDVRGRVLQSCGVPGLGGAIDHCTSDANNFYYTFTTGTDTSGPAFDVVNTAPSSAYIEDTTLTVDRNVPRSEILSINFSGGVDPASVTTDNFRVYKITNTPTNLNDGTCTGPGPAFAHINCPETTVDPNDFNIRVSASGQGIVLQYKDPTKWFDAYTWYRVDVKDILNLCGTSAKRSWVFETNNVTPGVEYVYPNTGFGFSCPSTDVYAQFTTSMMNIAASTSSCFTGNATSFNTQLEMYKYTAPVGMITPRLNWKFDQPPVGATDPNNYCKHLWYDPTTDSLPIDSELGISITTDRAKDAAGTKLTYGDTVPGPMPTSDPVGSWHFMVKKPGECANAPVVQSVSPGVDANGACISVLGKYFTDPAKPAPGTTYPRAIDTLDLSSKVQGLSTIKSWTDNTIVNRLDAGTGAGALTPNAGSDPATYYNYKVGVKYDAPIGLLESQVTPSSHFQLKAGAASNRPCLTSVIPDQGYAGVTKFEANGENFGTATGSIVTNNATDWVQSPATPWIPTKVENILVKASAVPMTTAVQIKNADGISNAVNFEVLPPATPGTNPAPEVITDTTCNLAGGTIPSPNPVNGDTIACKNSEITVRFTTNLDSSTVNSGTVQVVSAGPVIPLSITTVGNLVTIKPTIITDMFTSGQTYSVTLTTGIKSTAGVAMTAPYPWSFRIDTSGDVCHVTNVELNPNGTQRTNNPNYYPPISISALPTDTSCHTLTASGSTTWTNSKPAVGTINTTTSAQSNILTAPAAGAAYSSTTVTAKIQSITSAPGFTLEVSPTGCASTSDCLKNRFGASCNGSMCQGGQCTPVVNSIVPNVGPVGEWTTLNGCWFGAYVLGASKVNFSPSTTDPSSPGTEADTPDALICGNTWTNEQIIRIVPPTAATGPIQVIRGADGFKSTVLATGVPIGWGATLATQSTDVPTGHTGFSGMADAPSGGPQAWLAQELPGTNTVGAKYHVIGWVKGTIVGGSTAGLITRCSADVVGETCGYDLLGAAPGLLLSTTGWKKIDFYITNSNPADNDKNISIDCFANPGSKIYCDDITVTNADTGAVVPVNNPSFETTTPIFTVNTAAVDPGICKIDPVFGQQGSGFKVSGSASLISAAGTPRKFSFTNGATVDDDETTALPWTTTTVNGKVPGTATLGSNEVTATINGKTSNPLQYSVDPATCAQTCNTDAECNVVGSDINGCGTPQAALGGLGCCATRPKISSTNPAQGATNICLNPAPKITFDQPLDPSTITAGPSGTVQYKDGSRSVNGTVSYRTTATNEGEITYYPGLLSANSAQSMSFISYVPDPGTTLIVKNPSFETLTSGGALDPWNGFSSRITQADPAPGQPVGSHSGLADNSASSSGQVALAQNIANTNVVGTTYRVTGWVKVGHVSGSEVAGLITRCSDGSACGFDLFGQAPGLWGASNSLSDWTKLDFMVTKTSGLPSVNLNIDCFANAKNKIWCDDITVTKMIPSLIPNAIRGANGVAADVTGSPLTFTTNATMCTPDKVKITPVSKKFVSSADATFSAKIYTSDDVEFSPLPGLTLEWTWLSSTPTVASVTKIVATPNTATVHPVVNGATTITATTKVSVAPGSVAAGALDASINGREISGQSDVQVKFCASPWSFSDTDSNCDTGGTCEAFNFSTDYCGDTSGAPLPSFSYEGTLPGIGSIEGANLVDTTRLKSYFFKESGVSRDTIGLLIFKNDNFLSPHDWFTQRFPLDSSASSTTVAGYPAVKSGTTTYIGVTDLWHNPATGNDELRGLMFVFDYNSNNASPETVNIADQLLSGLQFNTNFSDSTQKAQVIRDTLRRQDLTSMKLSLEAYKTKNGAYPALSAGSYIPGFSTSAWPSWQSTLGSALGTTIPTDPVNLFVRHCVADPTRACRVKNDCTYMSAGRMVQDTCGTVSACVSSATDSHESSTCWSEPDKNFQCPTSSAVNMFGDTIGGSQLYAYRAQGGGVDLYTTMEYRGAGSFIPAVLPTGICAAPNACDCFNYSMHIGS